MNDNLHKDDLDDFLKKNLSSYSENPPDALWEGIEAGMPEGKPVNGFRITKQWWVAAAAAVLLCVFTCQHFYYKGKLEALEQQLTLHESRQGNPENPAATHPESEVYKIENEIPEMSVLADGEQSNSPKTELEKSPENGSGSSAIPFPPLTPLTPLITFPPLTTFPTTLPSTEKKLKDESGKLAEQDIKQQNQVPVKDENVLSSKPEQVVPPQNSEQDLLPKTSPEAVNFTVKAVDPLPNREIFLQIPVKTVEIDPVPVPGIKPKGLWTVQAHTAFLSQTNRITSLKPKPGPGGFKAFREEQSSQGLAWYTGIGLERRIDRHFSILSGLDYQRLSLTAEHRADLKFGDRDKDHHHGHGGHHSPHDHDFIYNLNTPSGQIEVAVRVTEVDSSMQIPDQEDVELAIRRQEDMQFLSIPLVAKLGFGKGRVRFHFKGGVLADILLKRQNSITDLQVLNPQLRIEQNTPPETMSDDLKGLSLSYLASAGVDVGLTPRFSLQLEPMLIGGLTGRETNNNISTNRMAGGVNVGLSMKF